MSFNVILAIAAAAYLAWTFFGRGKRVAPAEARKLVAAGARLVDVRSPGEFSSGHLDGALNVPVGELGGRIREIGEKTAPVVVYCASGMRSARAASLLRGAGFTQVHDLGGMGRWGG